MGTSTKIDLTGLKTEYLTVIEYAGKNKKGKRMWKCLCSLCGNYKNIITTQLIGKKVRAKSCGCYQKTLGQRARLDKKKKKEEKILNRENNKFNAGFNRVFRNYKRNAKVKKLDFSLEKEDFYNLTKSKCYYCDSGLINISIEKGQYSDYVYNGIDRVDNSKGYTRENCVPCCKICNQAKHGLRQDDFIIWVNKAFNHMKNSKILIKEREYEV